MDLGRRMAGHELRVIGDVELAVADITVRLPPQQAKVLAILAAAPPGHSVTREELVHGLWPTAPDGGRLWTVVSKLRMALRPLGVTVSPGRGTSGYTLAPLPGPDGVRPVDILDLTAVTHLVERGEQLLEQGNPVAAIEVLAEAAARWRGAPFTVGEGWPLPRLCRAAAERLDTQQRRLARGWVRAGLLADDLSALTWIDGWPELAAGLAGDRDVWLLRFVAALVAGDPSAAEAMLEERRPEWGYADPLTIRAAQLLELSERGAELAAPAGPATPDPAADPDTLRDWVATLPAGVAALLSVPDPGGRAQATAVEQLRAGAAGHGIRTFRAVCDTADDLAPWRALLRDIWAAALRDPQFEPETQLPELAETVASPRPSPVQPGALAGLGRAAVVLLAALSRRRPLLIVIDDARRLSTAAAELLVRIRADLRGARVGFAVVGADDGRFDRTTSDLTTDVLVVDSRPAPDPGSGVPSDWLCAAAVTAVDGRIDPVVVTRVLGVDAARADAGMAAAFRQGAIALTGGARFASAQARRDVLSELAADPARSRRLHRAAYDELTAGPAPGTPDPARVAEHALAARPDLPDEVVATACLAAAAAEQAARRHGSAVEFAVRGLALAVDRQLRFALQIVHGDSRHDRADMRAAQTAYRAAYAEASESVAMRAVAAVRLARRWSDPGRIDESLLTMLRTTRDELDAQGDPRLVELWMQVSGHLAHKSTMALPLAVPGRRSPAGRPHRPRHAGRAPPDHHPPGGVRGADRVPVGALRLRPARRGQGDQRPPATGGGGVRIRPLPGRGADRHPDRPPADRRCRDGAAGVRGAPRPRRMHRTRARPVVAGHAGQRLRSLGRRPGRRREAAVRPVQHHAAGPAPRPERLVAADLDGPGVLAAPRAGQGAGTDRLRHRAHGRAPPVLPGLGGRHGPAAVRGRAAGRRGRPAARAARPDRPAGPRCRRTAGRCRRSR